MTQKKIDSTSSYWRLFTKFNHTERKWAHHAHSGSARVCVSFCVSVYVYISSRRLTTYATYDCSTLRWPWLAREQRVGECFRGDRTIVFVVSPLLIHSPRYSISNLSSSPVNHLFEDSFSSSVIPHVRRRCLERGLSRIYWCWIMQLDIYFS